ILKGAPSWERWLKMGAHVAMNFVDAWKADAPLESHQAGELWAVYNKDLRRAVIIAHPLWRAERRYYTPAQEYAFDQLGRRWGTTHVKSVSMLELTRRPQDTFT